LCDNRFNVVLAAHWHGSKQSSDQDCKNFHSMIARFFTVPPVFAMLLNQSAKHYFPKASRSRASSS
jgi:hypothetical protein